MSKVYSLLLLIILNISTLCAQDSEIERLKKLTSNVSFDTSYVLDAINLGSLYKNSYVDSALFIAEKALTVSKKINYVKGEVLSLNLEGVLYMRLGNYSKALQSFLKALELSEKNNYSKGASFVLINLGDLYSKQDDLRKALDYVFQAKTISESINDTLNLTAIYINIGSYYEALNLFDSARINTELGRSLAEKITNPQKLETAHNYIGSALNSLGHINLKTKQYVIGLEYYRLSLGYFIDTEDYEGLCDSYLGLAKVFDANGNRDSSIFYAKKSLSTAIRQKFTKYVFDASEFISGYYKTVNQYDSAFTYLQTMIAAKDSLFSQEKVRQLQSLTINETIRQHEIAEEKLRAEEERKNNLQYIAIAVFIFIFSLVIILIVRQRIKLTTINFMVTVALLLIFEYISLLIHPTISLWTHHSPVYMLLILVGVASVLVPLHHRLEHWIKETLAHKIIHPRTKKVTFHTKDEHVKKE